MHDLDFENRRSWQGALNMLSVLCGESADLSFSLRSAGEQKLPAVEIRLDKPDELEIPDAEEHNGTTVEKWKFGTVILADKKPFDLPDGEVFILRKNGAAAITYRAFRETVRVLNLLPFKAEFSWSSLPLASACDDLSVTLRRERNIYAHGAVHTIWLRCPDDENLKAAMRSIDSCGQLRVQNMTTANTWITGSIDETAADF